MTIVIDPGHGGEAAAGRSTPYGARSVTGNLEKDLVLHLADRVVERLGGRATLTRADDRNLSIAARQATARAHGASAFVSIHARAAGRGGEVWVHPHAGAGSQRLASCLQGSLGATRRAPRVRTEPPMAVLDPTGLPGMAAALLEVDVLGNPEAESGEALDEVAAAIADGLLAWENDSERGEDAAFGGSPRYGEQRRGIHRPPLTYTDAAGAARVYEQWLRDLDTFVAGVPNDRLGVFPHASVCRIEVEMTDGGVYVGTGAYIAEDRVITAGHLFSVRQGQQWLFARRFRVARAHRPGGAFTMPWANIAGSLMTHPRWTASSPNAWDMAVLRVPRQAGVTPFALDVLNAGGVRVMYVGYPAARGAELEERQQSVDLPMDQQRVSPGTILTQQENFNVLTLAAPTQGGVSGAPLLRTVDGRLKIIGVHKGIAVNAGSEGHNALACAITEDKRRWATGTFTASAWPPGATATPHALDVEGGRPGFEEPHGAGEAYGGARYGAPWGVLNHFVPGGEGVPFGGPHEAEADYGDGGRHAERARVIRAPRATATHADAGHSRDWTSEPENVRVLHVMRLLVNTHGYPVNGAAGIVGNLLAESGVIPSRIEGSNASTPLRARDFHGTVVDFTPEQVMNRDASARRGPRLPGVGLAQWTSAARRRGLFAHTWQSVTLGPEILFSMDAQVDYLAHELRGSYARVHGVLVRPGVTVDDASDEVVYRFEVPGSVLDGNTLRPRADPQVQEVFRRRRALSHRALDIFRGARAPN